MRSAAGSPFADIFETFFGGGGGQGRGPRSRRERGQDALLRVEVDLDEVIFGTHRDLEVDTAVVCETCNGSCCQPGTHPVTCDICHGTGSIQRSVRSLLGNVMTSSPCGTCRQIIWEHCRDTTILLVNLQGQTEELQIRDLLPRAFDARYLKEISRDKK